MYIESVPIDLHYNGLVPKRCLVTSYPSLSLKDTLGISVLIIPIYYLYMNLLICVTMYIIALFIILY